MKQSSEKTHHFGRGTLALKSMFDFSLLVRFCFVFETGFPGVAVLAAVKLVL